ncbi:MAG: TolC family protein [Candidatus Cyclobacteriaceae bacterium M2_1C_046]
MNKIFIVVFSFITFSLSAQNGVWTLEECVDYALEHNLALKRAKLGLENSHVDLKQSKFDLLPGVNASTSYGYNWGRSIDPTTNQFITERINFTSVNASAGITLFSAGRQINRIRQNEHALDATKFDVEAAKNNLVFNIIALYTNVVFNQELVENAEKQLENTEKQLLRIEKQVEAGALPRSDLLDIEAQAASNELSLIQQQNALEFSLLQLKQALQLPVGTEFSVVVPEEMQIDPLAAPVVEYTPEEIYEQAVQVLPEIKSAQEQIQSSVMGVKIAKGNLYPSVNANTGLSSNYSDRFDNRFIPDGTQTPVLDENNQQVAVPTPLRTVGGEQIMQLVYEPGGAFQDFGFVEQLEENLSRFVSLGMSVPIFNGWSARAGIQRAIINQEQAEINLQETKNIIRQDVENAYNDVVAASKSYLASQKQVNAREEAFRMTQKRYELGATTYIDYQLSENQLFQAKSDLLRAKYDYIYKTRILDFYLGNPLGF